ncbi:MAG: hypothetical protein WDO15_16770 [Bacteroidota bacterium]
MKRVLILVLFAAFSAEARTFTAVANGNWVTPKTWSCNCTPRTATT